VALIRRFAALKDRIAADEVYGYHNGRPRSTPWPSKKQSVEFDPILGHGLQGSL
jgi:hypothetical protein